MRENQEEMIPERKIYTVQEVYDWLGDFKPDDQVAIEDGKIYVKNKDKDVEVFPKGE